MNLLIVDDDFHVIQSIQRNINWETLAIEKVFTALGPAAARQILQQEAVDILICDIEMPKENGLELVHWLRGFNLHTEVIFLTSFAKFEYAQKAIQLNSLEYILKPVDYRKLSEAIAAAAANVKKKRQNQIFRRRNKFWEQNKEKVIGHFWQRVINGSSPLSEEQLETLVDECGLPYIRKSVFLPLLIQADAPMTENFQALKEEILADARACFDCSAAVRPTGTEGAGAGEDVLSLPLDDHDICFEYAGCLSDVCCLLIFRCSMASEHSTDPQEMLGFFTAEAEKFAACERKFYFGLGMWSIVDLIREDIENVLSMMFESPRNARKVLWLSEWESVKMSDEGAVDLKRWAALLQQNESEKLHSEIEFYLTELELKNLLSARRLQQIGLDITQIVYAFLNRMNIHAHLLFSSEESRQLYSRAALSKSNMLRYVDHLLERSMQCRDEVKNSQDVLDIVLDYMNKNFSKNLTREDISGLVYLNPDYLSRLFKRKVGLSLNSYLIMKRIEMAKQLLCESSTPVSVISAQVGYDNFAYFTKLFKEKTGLSPNEFRKKHKHV